MLLLYCLPLKMIQFVKKTFSIRSIEEYRNQPVYKFVATSPSMKRLDAPRKALEEEFLFCIQDVSHGVVNLELINRKFNKGTAVRKVCEYLQIPVSDSVGFGDSMNDKEMLETAGLSICMENGSEAVVLPPLRLRSLQSRGQSWRATSLGLFAIVGCFHRQYCL